MDDAEQARLIDEIFSISSLLGALPAERADRLRTAASARSAQPGEAIVAEGEAVDRLWFVVDGACEVSASASGERVAIKELGRGAFFGEVSIQSGKAATASVTAIRESALVGFEADAVRTLIESDERTKKILAGVTLARAKETIGKVLEE